MRLTCASTQRTAISRKDQFAKATLLVFVCGALLRVVLALVNQQANDNHLEVIIAIADENRFPAKEEMWEAFQPKLYHVTVAALWKILSLQALPIRVRTAQLISCAAGILTLVLVWRFLRRQVTLSGKAGFLAFALVALNPGLTGINAQATNDSFVILFGTLSLYSGCRFFERWRAWDFSWMTVSAILAALSKGNGLVVFIAISAVFALTFLWSWHGYWVPCRHVLLYGVVFLVSFLAVVPTLGPYGEHYRRHGSPFTMPILPAPFPKVFERTLVYKPGVTSIVDSFLTFRLVDMLKNPLSTTDAERYPQHRTSLWSQLYGRAHFVHFDDWPPSWRVSTLQREWARSLVRNLGRLIFLCALFPTVLLMVAWCRQVTCYTRNLSRLGKPQGRLGDWLLNLAGFGYFAFILVYALRYRDYAVMKAIFIFPGLLAFLTLLARECDRFYAHYGGQRVIRLSADIIFAALLLLYMANTVVLIGQLSLH
jgi:hypothetical protein